MGNAGLDEAMNHKLESRLLGEIFNNLKYADDTILMAESEEKLKSLLTRGKEESEKAGLNSTFKKLRSSHQHQKFKMASNPITSWQIEREEMEAVTDCIFLSSKIAANSDCSMKLKDTFSLEGKL